MSSLFHRAQHHLGLMNGSFYPSDEEVNQDTSSAGSDDAAIHAYMTQEYKPEEKSGINLHNMKMKKDVDALEEVETDINQEEDDKSAEEEVCEETGDENEDELTPEQLERLRNGKLGDIEPFEYPDGHSGFRCRWCPKVQLRSEGDAAAHLSSKGHRKSFKKAKKAMWGSDQIEARRAKNKRKREKQRERKGLAPSTHKDKKPRTSLNTKKVSTSTS